MKDVEFLAAKAKWVRQTVVRMAYKANSGHLSTAFSQAELLTALYYGGILRHDPQRPTWPERDRFILSKGQGGIGLYPILADLGYFPLEELDNFCGEDSLLGVHAEWNAPGVEVITGSLGHGLPMAVGMAMVAKQRAQQHIIVCMLGDGELYEGSSWEAMWSAYHHRLNRLIVIIDANKQATIGRLNGQQPNDGPGQMSIANKMEAFGFDTIEIDGHDFRAIFNVLDPDWLHQPRTHGPQTDLDDEYGKPLCIVAHTVKGKGCKIMEDGSFFPTHYRLPKGDDLKSLLVDLDLDAAELKAYAGDSVGY
jgi:transketolase